MHPNVYQIGGHN